MKKGQHKQIFDDLVENPSIEYPESWKDKLKEEYAIALSLEPTMEEINNLPSDNKKGTELEMILMELKDLTINFTKKEEKVRKDALKGINHDLTKAEEMNNSQNKNSSETKLKHLKRNILLKNVQNAKTLQSSRMNVLLKPSLT